MFIMQFLYIFIVILRLIIVNIAKFVKVLYKSLYMKNCNIYIHNKKYIIYFVKKVIFYHLSLCNCLKSNTIKS